MNEKTTVGHMNKRASGSMELLSDVFAADTESSTVYTVERSPKYDTHKLKKQEKQR